MTGDRPKPPLSQLSLQELLAMLAVASVVASDGEKWDGTEASPQLGLHHSLSSLPGAPGSTTAVASAVS